MGLVFLSLLACHPASDVTDSDVPVTTKIYGGDAPTEWYHDATVALHNRSPRGTITTSPFCSGTLIDSEWVLTAGHCVTSGRSVMRSNRVVVYEGNDPSSDISGNTYTVDAVYRHSGYNSYTLLNDIGLLHLSTPITSVTAVPPLPTASPYGLTSADIGATLNFAGFGDDESGGYGVKLQVDIAFGAFGCGVGGCPSGYTSSTYTTAMISYEQDGTSSSTSDDVGPCLGDSGGPAFLDDGTDVFVVGVTSWGDSRCRSYGVSTRVDSYETWIEGYTGDLNGA